MEAGLDTGPILVQETIPITEADTAGAIHDSLSELGGRALLTALEGLESGSLRSRPQPEQGASYAAKISKSEAAIDWSRSADEIARQVRAFNPWPIAETQMDGEQLRVYAASAMPASDVGVPGTITVTREGDVVVACGIGALILVEVQRPGRRAISGRDWAHTFDLANRRLGR